MKNRENKRHMSKLARMELKALQEELQKANPDHDLINYLDRKLRSYDS